MARKIAEVLKQLNLLPSDRCRVITPRDVTKGYVGQSGEAMKKAMQEAKGEHIFIILYILYYT